MNAGTDRGNKEIANQYRPFLQDKIKNLKLDEILIVTGSLYFLSEAKPVIKHFLNNK
mgnify:CR=1 FL=1